MNSLNIIAPYYKHYGSWVFDDERVGQTCCRCSTPGRSPYRRVTGWLLNSPALSAVPLAVAAIPSTIFPVLTTTSSKCCRSREYRDGSYPASELGPDTRNVVTDLRLPAFEFSSSLSSRGRVSDSRPVDELIERGQFSTPLAIPVRLTPLLAPIRLLV